MAPSYLTRSRLAWLGIALIVLGLGTQAVPTLPVWTIPAGYFAALAGAAILFVGWVRWRKT